LNVQLLLAKTGQKIREVGFWATLRNGIRMISRRRVADDFDLQHGTDTGGEESLWRLTIDSPSARFGRKYQPSSEAELSEAVRFLDVDPRTLTFIDLGCGKGRTLLVAAKLGFKQVIGVEFTQELAEVARKNLQKMGVANGGIVQGDVGEYRFPDGDLVVYLYNPFSEEVMRKVVPNLRECASRKLYVIYKVPECMALFDSGGFLTRLGSPQGRENILVWTTAPLAVQTGSTPGATEQATLKAQ
jgi:SAM-dependent methyltransferase